MKSCKHHKCPVKNKKEHTVDKHALMAFGVKLHGPHCNGTQMATEVEVVQICVEQGQGWHSWVVAVSKIVSIHKELLHNLESNLQEDKEG